ncbi:hypothetical protein MAM1_0014d01407 [Mucor ambiguus]|uniref:C2H2-type domain-containing protein n=1 Tax=Mucor ambiguus TaxID=91626 RepID=A0A0C9LR58_9FUNG|nr:hypothetical protein MAM1_0014d01407 [Mucor ambiguus]
MKLRDRKEHVLHNAKQEDLKLAFDITDSTTSGVNDPNSFDLALKQEDIKEDDMLLHQDDEFDKGNYSYRCTVCKMKMESFQSVLEHRSFIHDIKLVKNRKIKNMDTEPDVYSLNSYCKPCEKGYKNAPVYRRHLKKAHYMILKPIYKWKPPRDDTVPDLHDPDFYCRSCERKLANKNTFKCHLAVVHALSPSPPKKSEIKPDADDPDNHCRACQKTYRSQGRYGIHLRLMHQMTLPSLRVRDIQKDCLPDPNNARNYCTVCKKFYKTRTLYRAHCRSTHFMVFGR